MAVTAAEMQILLRARDEASGVVQKFRGELGSIAKNLPREALQGLKSDLGSAGKAMPTAEAKRLAGEFDSVHGAAGRAGGGVRGLVDGLGKLGFAVFGVQQLAGAVTGLVGPFVRLASDLNETVNKVSVVFGDAAEDVMKFGDTSARALGMSKNTALSAAGTFGNLFTTIGLGKKTSADFSTQLLQNAADLASFNNIDPTVVLDKLRAGLVGETEPLRALGIDVSDAAMKVQAATQGIGKSTEAMTQAEKVALRYALVQKQMGNAAGDFARTSGDLANSQRILAASWQDLQTQVGTLFLPAMNAIVNALKDAVGGVQTWLEENKVAIQAWGEIIGEGVNTAVGAVRGLASAFGQAFGMVLDIVSGVGQAIYEALSWINPFASHSPSLVSQVESGVDEIIGAYRRMAGIEEPIGRAADAIEDFKAMGKDALAGVIEGTEAAIDATRERVEAMKEVIGATKEELSGLKDSVRDAKDALRGLADVPIQGMGEFDAQLDAIKTKSNEVKLQLTQMKLAGAPKEQIEALEAELRRLGLEADRVELEKRLKFDPMQKQIKDLVKPPGSEMAFEDIIKQAQAFKGQIGELEPAIADADKRFAEQTALLKPLERAMAGQEKVLKAQREAYQDMAKEVKAAGAAVKGAFGAGAGPNKALDAFKDAGKTVDTFKTKVAEVKTRITSALVPVRKAVDDYIVAPFKYAKNLLAIAFTGGEPVLALKVLLQDIGKAVSGADWDGMLKGIGDFGGKVVNWMGQQWGNLKDKWPEIWSLAGDIAGGLGGIALNVVGWIKEQWGKIPWADIWKGAGNIWTGITNTAGDLLGALGGLKDKAVAYIAAHAQEWADTFSTWAVGAWNWVSGAGGALLGALGRFLGDAIGYVVAHAAEWGDTLLTWTVKLWEWVGRAKDNMLDAISDLAASGQKKVIEEAPGWETAVQSWVERIGVELGRIDWNKTFGNIGKKAGELIANALTAPLKMATGVITGLINTLMDTVKGIVSPKGDKGSGVTVEWGKLWNGLKDIVGGVLGAIGSLIGDFYGTFVATTISRLGAISDEWTKTKQKVIGDLDEMTAAIAAARAESQKVFTISPEGVYPGRTPLTAAVPPPPLPSPGETSPGMTYEEREAERRLYGYQHGGAFTVGGAGGTDSQTVAFKATPGERVTITPAAARAATSTSNIVSNSDNRMVNITNNIVAPNPASVADRFVSDPRIMRHLRLRPVW